MPELPEITSRAREIDRALAGKTVKSVDVLEPKCLNVSPAKFKSALAGARIKGATNRGKWIFVETTKGWLLVNLGMGGELLLAKRGHLAEKHRVAFRFTDGTALTAGFWWFGYVHWVAPDGLAKHAMTRVLGPNAVNVGADALWEMTRGRRGSVKAFLLDQSNLAGIGNAYIHDILFLAGLHPQRTLDTIGRAGIDRLAKAIQDGLRPSIKKGGAFYELNLHGRKGGFAKEDIIIGYREGEKCPRCKTAIKKIKTGSTSTFICPRCQPLKARKR